MGHFSRADPGHFSRALKRASTWVPASLLGAARTIIRLHADLTVTPHSQCSTLTVRANPSAEHVDEPSIDIDPVEAAVALGLSDPSQSVDIAFRPFGPGRTANNAVRGATLSIGAPSTHRTNDPPDQALG